MQTSVKDTMAIGLPGQPADQFTSSHGDIVSATSEEDVESGSALAFGTMVAVGSDSQGCLALATANDICKGIAVFGHYHQTPGDTVDVEGYQAAKPALTIGVGRTGRYAVIIEETVAFGDAVHVRAVADTGEIAGAFGKTDNNADSIDCSDFCSWVVGGEVDDETGFGIAILDVNMALAPTLQASDS